MICHANTSSYELIEYLREVAIRAKAKPAWIDAIDRLQSADHWEAETEKVGEELHDLKENFNEMREALETFLQAFATFKQKDEHQNLDYEPDLINAVATAAATLDAYPELDT